MKKKSEHSINRINLAKHVAKAQKGNKKALEYIVNETSDYIYYYCLTLLCDEDEALEAVQDIYVILIEKLNTLKNPKAFLGWLKVVTSNYCKNKISRKINTVSFDECENTDFLNDDIQINPEECIETAEICNEIISTVKQLPDYQKECVLMYYYHQMSISEIATILEVKEGTVKSRLFNARKAIKSRLENLNFFATAPLSYITYSLNFDSQRFSFPVNTDKILALEDSVFAETVDTSILNTIPLTVAKASVASKIIAGVGIFTAGAVVTGGIAVHTMKDSDIEYSDTQPMSVVEQETTVSINKIQMEELYYANGLTDDDRRTVLTYNENEDMNSYNNKNYVYDLMCNAIDNYKTLQGTFFCVDFSNCYYSSYCFSFENGANSKEVVANSEGIPISFHTYDGLTMENFSFDNSAQTTDVKTFSEEICDELIVKRNKITENDFRYCISKSSKPYQEACELDFVSMIASKNREKETDGEPTGFFRTDYACLPMSNVQYAPEITAYNYLYNFDNWEIVDTSARLGRFVSDRECYSIKGTNDGFNGVYSFEMLVDKETGALLYFLGCDSEGEEIKALISYEFTVNEDINVL